MLIVNEEKSRKSNRSNKFSRGGIDEDEWDVCVTNRLLFRYIHKLKMDNRKRERQRPIRRFDGEPEEIEMLSKLPSP